MDNHSLQMINLDQELDGHRKFLSCWVCRSDDLTFIVDPGPTATADRLIAELQALPVSRLDYILITHIHLDHGAGAAEVIRAFPGARVLCHERGVKHMLDPSRLWQSSRAVLGHVAEAYGPPSPVPEESMATVAEVARAGIRVIDTPGHAAHHLSFLFGDTLFVGEAVGLRVPIPGFTYLRPATPRRFVMELALESIDRLRALDPAPRRMAFPHFGVVDNPTEYMEMGREQIPRWVRDVRRLVQETEGDLVQRAHEHFLATDALYTNVIRLDEDVQRRERHYLGQTLEGMVGYIQSS